MKKRDLKVGMKVVVTGVQSSNESIVGRKGVVMSIIPGGLSIGVRFFRSINHGHNIGGNCTSGFGYWFDAVNLSPVVKA